VLFNVCRAGGVIALDVGDYGIPYTPKISQKYFRRADKGKQNVEGGLNRKQEFLVEI